MLLISAAEASGDRLAADLVQRLGVQAKGLAGPRMRAAGVQPVAHAEELGVMGLVEVIGAVPTAWRLMKQLEAAMEDVDLLVVVDAPDFHLPLARRARKRGVKVVWYVSPQVWAWRRSRALEIAELAEVVICLLPFEPGFYPDGKAVFLGHPIAEATKPLPRAYGDTWCVAPGSRQQEVDRLLPVMLEATQERPRRISRAPGLKLDGVDGLRAAVEPAVACLVASGTATLELACMNRPMVVCYAVNPLTHFIGRRLVDVPFIALPNLILGRRVVPEFVQDLDAARLRAALLEAEVGQDLLEVRHGLRPDGALDRITDCVRSYL